MTVTPAIYCGPVPSESEIQQRELAVVSAVAAFQSDPHRVLDIVASSTDRDAAQAALMEALGVDKIGALAMLDTQLYRMTKEQCDLVAQRVDNLREGG